MDGAPPSAAVGVIYADEKPSRRAVSISSVDSEPIVRAASARSVASSASHEGGGRAPRGWLVSEGDDVPLDDAGMADATLVLPIRQISEAPVAVVSAISAASRSCVAEAVPQTLPMDVGTRLCLSDGTFVGYVSSVLGPVKQAFYVVKSTRDDFHELIGDHRLAEAVPLHYDLHHPQIMYDPFEQCDAAKGTDASYINDEELPEYVRPDFSDDEKEMEWKRQKRRRGDDNESISSDEMQVDIEWSKLQLDEDAVPCGDPHVVIPQWIRSAPR
ncbi:Gar1/Naf1 RNA binding region family protein [Leishmania donovani]|uniref:H/ACA ribonucleoprotein complex subunit n=2 Tax=Leishmania donovani TaxID=5661 RepID=A0A504XCF5_LEIDO|nr:Gar1/Naf1 RNA binding region family protein [Leishmania donovani]